MKKYAFLLAPAVIASMHAKAEKAPETPVRKEIWSCTVNASYQCQFGKTEEITRTALARDKERAQAKAEAAARHMSCMPSDGKLIYFEIDSDKTSCKIVKE